MDTSFAPGAEVFSDSEGYMIVDHRVPFSNTASNVRTSLFHHSRNNAPLSASSGSQQTYMNLSSFNVFGSRMGTSNALDSREDGGVGSNHNESHANLDGDELSARLLFLAERTPMSREDLLFSSFMEGEGPPIIPQWQQSTPSRSSSDSSAYAEDTLVTPPNRTVPRATNFSHSSEPIPIFPRYFHQQSTAPGRRVVPGPIDHPRSPLSYKSPLMEQWRDAVLSPNVLFDSDAEQAKGGLGISSARPRVTKRARDDDDNDEEEEFLRKMRGDNRWRMYC